MDFSFHSLNALFQQLGLPAEDADIDIFIRDHTLKSGTRLVDADFWTEAQSGFLQEALDEDADWTEIVDQLDSRLRQ
jgi:hypothetical protein